MVYYVIPFCQIYCGFGYIYVTMNSKLSSYIAILFLAAFIVCTSIYVITSSTRVGFPQFQPDLEELPLTDDDIYVDDAEAQRLFDEVRIYCWILTTKSGMVSKAAGVNFTWAPRCNKHVFFASAHGEETAPGVTAETATQPAVTIDLSMGTVKNYTMANGDFFSTISIGDMLYVSTPDGWGNLTEKSREILQFLFITEYHNFDWFLKADDDTYVIMENLRYYLKDLDSNKPAYMGYQLEPPWFDSPYMSGGAGYLLSKAGLKNLVEKGLNVKGMCLEKGSFEDLEVGRCAFKAGVPIISSRDVFERETFHPDNLADSIPGPPPQWLYYYSRNKPKGGSECCSQFTISFHRMSTQDMLMMDHLLYKTSVYGRRTSGTIAKLFRHGKVKKLPNGVPTIPTVK